MYTVYVLRSQATNRFYTGLTSDLNARLMQHNSDLSRSTKHRGPWCLVHKEEFESLSEAARRERYLKSGHGRDKLRRILLGNAGEGSAG
jgi:putative endonuclease